MLVEIMVYEDRSFIFIMKILSVVVLIKEVLCFEKGSVELNCEKVGWLIRD